jgi:hypothetical protein
VFLPFITYLFARQRVKTLKFCCLRVLLTADQHQRGPGKQHEQNKQEQEKTTTKLPSLDLTPQNPASSQLHPTRQRHPTRPETETGSPGDTSGNSEAPICVGIVGTVPFSFIPECHQNKMYGIFFASLDSKLFRMNCRKFKIKTCTCILNSCH